MSDLDEKLAPATKAPGGTAKATLKQLLARWGTVDLVRLEGMHSAEVWRHIQGKGADALFERQDTASLEGLPG